MSLLPSATFAGPSQAEALWAVAGSTGPGGGVTQLVAGSNITLDPPTGEGVVTINATGGGGGGVTSVTASGAGITASPTSGAVVVANTGVTSLVAGAGITLSGATGAVTIDAPGTTGAKTSTIWRGGAFPNAPGQVTQIATDMLTWGPDSSVPASFDGWIAENPLVPNVYTAIIANPAWNVLGDAYFLNISFAPGVVTDQRVIASGNSGVQIRVSVTYDGISPKRIAGQLARFAGFPISVLP